MGDRPAPVGAGGALWRDRPVPGAVAAFVDLLTSDQAAGGGPPKTRPGGGDRYRAVVIVSAGTSGRPSESPARSRLSGASSNQRPARFWVLTGSWPR